MCDTTLSYLVYPNIVIQSIEFVPDIAASMTNTDLPSPCRTTVKSIPSPLPPSNQRPLSISALSLRPVVVAFTAKGGIDALPAVLDIQFLR